MAAFSPLLQSVDPPHGRPRQTFLMSRGQHHAAMACLSHPLDAHTVAGSSVLLVQSRPDRRGTSGLLQQVAQEGRHGDPWGSSLVELGEQLGGEAE